MDGSGVVGDARSLCMKFSECKGFIVTQTSFGVEAVGSYDNFPDSPSPGPDFVFDSIVFIGTATSTKVGTRVLPFVGWALLAWDGLDFAMGDETVFEVTQTFEITLLDEDGNVLAVTSASDVHKNHGMDTWGDIGRALEQTGVVVVGDGYYGRSVTYAD